MGLRSCGISTQCISHPQHYQPPALRRRACSAASAPHFYSIGKTRGTTLPRKANRNQGEIWWAVWRSLARFECRGLVGSPSPFSYQFHLCPSAVQRFDCFSLSVRVYSNLKSKQIFHVTHPCQQNQEQRFAHALGWNQPGQSCGQGEYKLKTPWVSCLLLTVQLVSNSSSFLLFPSVFSGASCWLHSLPSSDSSTLLRKQGDRAWITTWVTNSQYLVLLRAGGENSFPLCDSPSPVTLQKRLSDTLPLLPKLLSIVCSHACKQHLEGRRDHAPVSSVSVFWS